ncbi:hypothetical protein EN962_20470 [Mesorhizobium sp. M7A.F.Ca.CA.001.09.2.1]|uniref:Uncharacterized protein n=1 Tax=Mesorhizobium ciceri TaxID=39645 RepID=A0AB38TD48_9HYPH|nr:MULTISPECIES: hypothetical protein [Mesorhizobium]RUY50331.1 hypothetical protein EN981_14230 [Mesorhizobium sp. M7A.F.Ca.CA.001.13.2.1]MDF3213189.1 hypothetical protein [Mesorhizobium ciceri]RUY61303.1 hypothetical protein EN965_27660 [Mesorhizobium sp. M7A.F.Ca.CA.001.05.1.1]RUY64976.1 hypothetical protein EN980_23980 [Mesorhizobium sp. M7A.F.Ca.CA.001.13.1.1]RUY76230.1 hypothetical protein EN962_20470 [Mesorhizobium sp. M7A.F.Ca.CA.001.09.2.1]
MSLERIHLRKLLRFFYLPTKARIAALRDDIRSDLRKDAGVASGGGDYHVPFWTDAKQHAAGQGDLPQLTHSRVAANPRRQRLYPLLQAGFLTWWNEKRRWINEPFQILDYSVKNHFRLPTVNCVVKIENLLSVKIGDESHRLVYPYFSEEPVLNEEGSRLGIWILSQSLPNFSPNDFRVLDVLRGTSFATIDHPLQGNEEALFMGYYNALLTEWEKLREEYR